MIIYLTYILIALTSLVLIYIKPGFIKMASQNMALTKPTVKNRIIGFAIIIFCVILSLWMLVLLAAGVLGIMIVLK